MGHQSFLQHHQELVKEAVVIAEEMTSDFFKLSPSHWRRARYDIATLKDLGQAEISPHALALVAKYGGRRPDRQLPSTFFDFYRICLQDHNILKALEAWKGIALQALLVYVVTHELVHVVRFSQFLALFEAPEAERREEEKRVHSLTQKILAPLNFLDLPPVFRYYC